jgi:hypothetical protein
MKPHKTLSVALTAVLTLGCAPTPVYIQQPVRTAPVAPTTEVTVNSIWCVGIHESNRGFIDRITNNGEECLNSNGGFKPKKKSCELAMAAMIAHQKTNVGKLSRTCLDAGYVEGVGMTVGEYERWINHATAVLDRLIVAIRSYNQR